MKKTSKLAVSMLICGLILLAGCAMPSTSLPNELRAKSANYPESVNIIAPDFFKPTGAANAEEAKQKWLDEMSERYGVKFNIFSSYKEAIENINSSASSQASNGLSNNNSFVGLTAIDSAFILKGGILNDIYMPLDGYLSDNPVWNALPEAFKSLFKVDGHIYAIPTCIIQAQMSRIINDEALAETGITVTDLASFHDFSLAYAQKAGKGTGRGRFTGTYLMPGVTDILNAFGLYPGKDQTVQFNYDPTANCYVDWLTKDTAAGALEYLRDLSKVSALCPADADETAQSFKNGLFASEYAEYFDYENCTEVLTLNSEYPQMLFTEISGFAMTADTPQPKETCNLLIDMLFGSEENYLECRLGSSDSYTLNSDGTITIKTAQDSLGNTVLPCMPNLAGDLSDIFPYSDTELIYNNDTKKNEARLKVLNDSLKNGSVVEIPLEYQLIKSSAYDANIIDAANLYYICVSDALHNPDKTIQQILDEYKAAMLNLGGNAMLDEMNAAIGKQTAYYYG